MKATISSPLNRFATRTNTPQKVIAYAAKLGRSTINNYFHGTPIRANEATDIANSMNDSELSYEMANLFLGIPKKTRTKLLSSSTTLRALLMTPTLPAMTLKT